MKNYWVFLSLFSLYLIFDNIYWQHKIAKGEKFEVIGIEYVCKSTDAR